MEFSRLEFCSGKLFPSPGDLLNPGIQTRSSTLQANSLSSEPQGKPKDTGVGSLSLLQGIFLQGKGVREGEVQKKNETGTLQEQITFNEARRGSSQISELQH